MNNEIEVLIGRQSALRNAHLHAEVVTREILAVSWIVAGSVGGQTARA